MPETPELPDTFSLSPAPTTLTPTLRLTLNQERRLLLEAYCKEKNVRLQSFTQSCVLRLDGTLNESCLRQSLEHLICRHGSLRTRVLCSSEVTAEILRERAAKCFREGLVQEETFYYSTAETCHITVETHGLENLPESERQGEIWRVIRNTGRVPFDYATPPLIRGLLFRLDAHHHVLALIVAHLVCDAESLKILQADFGAIYNSLRTGTAFIHEAPAPFQAFVAWQEGFLNSQHSRAARGYWKSQWDTFIVSRLSTNKLMRVGRHKECSDYVVDVKFAFEKAQCYQIGDFCRKSGVTLSMFFLASFYLMVTILTKERSVAVWMNFANRTHQQFEKTVGWFVNSHLIGISSGKSCTGRGIIASARDAIVNAITYQDLPLVNLWNTLKRTPGPYGVPVLFSVRSEGQNMDSRVKHDPCNAPPLSVSKYYPVAHSSKTVAEPTSNAHVCAEVIEKDEQLALSFCCREGGSIPRSSFDSLLTQWAAASLMLVQNPDEQIDVLRMVFWTPP